MSYLYIYNLLKIHIMGEFVMADYMINKAFVEARYNNAILFNDFNKLQLISRQVTKFFPISDYNANQKQLILSNDEKHRVVTIFQNRFVIDIDEPPSFENFKNIVNQTMEVIFSALDITKINRFGFRSLIGKEFENLNSVDDFIKNNLLKISTSDYNILGTNVRDCTISFTFDNDKYNVRLNIHPNLFQMLEVENNIIKRNMQKVQLLSDVDIFQEGSLDSQSILLNFLRDAIKINNENIKKFITEIGGNKYEK